MRISPYVGGLLQGEQVIDKEFIGSPLSQKDKNPDELEPVPDFVLSGVLQESLELELNGCITRNRTGMEEWLVVSGRSWLECDA